MTTFINNNCVLGSNYFGYMRGDNTKECPLLPKMRLENVHLGKCSYKMLLGNVV